MVGIGVRDELRRNANVSAELEKVYSTSNTYSSKDYSSWTKEYWYTHSSKDYSSWTTEYWYTHSRFEYTSSPVRDIVVSRTTMSTQTMTSSTASPTDLTTSDLISDHSRASTADYWYTLTHDRYTDSADLEGDTTSTSDSALSRRKRSPRTEYSQISTTTLSSTTGYLTL